MLSVRLPKELEDRLEFLANKTHRSKSFYVTKALEEYLENKRDYALALEAFDDYITKKKIAVPLSEAKKLLEIDE